MKRLTLLAITLVLMACGGSTATSVSSRCTQASEPVIDALTLSLTVQGGGTLSGAVMVKSTDFNSAYFVAADIDGPGMEGREVGVWVTNDITGSGLIYSVNAIASEFSDWGPGGQTDAQFSMSDDGAAEAAACVG